MKLQSKETNEVVEDDWCDDCGICTFMRESEKLGRTPTIQEMNKVFAEQNKINEMKLFKENN